MESVGAVDTRLFIKTDARSIDVYLRVCDVLPTGESINVCETIRRLWLDEIDRDDDEVFELSLPLSPVAYRFGASHRIRLQISGGAHPMYARNTCSGEPLATATTITLAHNEIHHSPARPSSLTLHRPLP